MDSPAPGRHSQIYASACALGELVGANLLAWDTAFDVLLNAAIQSGKPEGESRRTIADGVTKGARNPREVRGWVPLGEYRNRQIDSPDLAW
jgi:hypothetical protein